MDEQCHVGAIRLTEWPKDVWLRRLTWKKILHPAHDANDFDNRPLRVAETEALSDRGRARPDGVSKRIVHDCYLRRLLVVALSEESAFEEGYAHRREVVVTDDVAEVSDTIR